MHERLVIVPKKKTVIRKIVDTMWLVLACLMLILSFIVPSIFIIPAILFGLLWYFTGFRSDVEYEYTYYDGELRFACISNKSRRKNLARIQMDDVLAFAPKGDRSVYKYETDRNLSCKNLTSRRPDAKVYELVCKGEKGMTRYEIEPDEAMLDEILIKYPRSVIK